MRVLNSKEVDYWEWVSKYYDPEQNSPVVFDRSELKDECLNVNSNGYFNLIFEPFIEKYSLKALIIVVGNKVVCNFAYDDDPLSLNPNKKKKILKYNEFNYNSSGNAKYWFGRINELCDLIQKSIDKSEIVCHKLSNRRISNIHGTMELNFEPVLLKDFEVQKNLDAFEAYQEISMKIAEINNLEKPTPKMSDLEEIDRHGMDRKTSFRH